MSITITITRDDVVGAAQMGTFQAGSVSGVTLENDSKKIPTGSYSASLYHSPKFQRTVIRLDNVPGRTDIEIHVGNYVADTTGCILVGKNANKSGKDGTITNSKEKLDELVEKCKS